MNFSNLFNGAASKNVSAQNIQGAVPGGVSNLASKIPGGLVGGAITGGLVAMLLGNKTARKTVGTAAKYGGAAVLGGLAYKAYKNWQTTNSTANSVSHHPNLRSFPQAHIPGFESEALEHSRGLLTNTRFELAIVKAMIASARADGNIDQDEQLKISEAIESMNLDASSRYELLDLFTKPISIHDFVADARTVEQKAELYLASCLAINLDHEAEYAHLSKLSKVLNLPVGLEHQLRQQARSALNVAV